MLYHLDLSSNYFTGQIRWISMFDVLVP
jgi:hypothetical protein